MNRRSMLLATVLASTFAAVPAHAADAINFGIISTESAANLKQSWDPLLADMEKETGLKVTAFFAPDYAGVIEGMRFNKVQVAWFGNKSAMEAVDRAEGEVFAKTVDPKGEEGYYSLLVVRKDSPLKSLDDVLANKSELTLGYGDPNSTSGTLVPGYYAFAQNNVDPTKDFKRMVRTNHQGNLLAVAAKQVDVVTNNTDNWTRFEQSNPEKLAELRQIWKSPLIPSDPLVWRKDLDPKIQAKIKAFVLSYGDDEREKAILGKIGFSGFKPSDDTQLITVRELTLVKDKLKVESDDKLSAEEKAAKLKELDRKLGELRQKLAAR